MKNDIALLTLCLQVRQTLPCLQVFGTCYCGRCRCCTQVARHRVIVTLCAEDAINPSVLMRRDAHVIDIRCRNYILWHCYRFFPEAEVINTVRTLCNSKETLAVSTLNTDNQKILAVPFYCTRVKCCIHHYSLHQVRVVLLTEIITPFQRRVLCCYDRVLVFCVNTVTPLYWFILQREQFLVAGTQCFCSLCKICHDYNRCIYLMSLRNKVTSSA